MAVFLCRREVGQRCWEHLLKLRFYLCLCEIRVRRAALERRPVVITSLALCGRHSSSSDDMEYEDYTSTSKVYDTTRVPIGLGSRFR